MQDDLTRTIGAELGVGDLPSEEQEKLIAGFGEVALKAATIAVLEKLPEGKRDEFAALAEAGDPATLSSFLDREMPGHEQIASAAVALELKRFKESQSA
ncbi:MAG: hypothetical protein Q7S95_01965 [bacterium]|nr:hypothetical protein [bacterium]